MKIIRIFILCFALLTALAIIAMQKSTPCKTITVTTGIEVYTEANAASNQIAVLKPGDVIYLCGE